MSERQFRQDLSRLQALAAIKDAQVMANPQKYLDHMQRHCHELLRVLELVEYALSPDFIFDVWEESDFPEPTDIQGEALIRCNKALEIITQYKHGDLDAGPSQSTHG